VSGWFDWIMIGASALNLPFSLLNGVAEGEIRAAGLSRWIMKQPALFRTLAVDSVLDGSKLAPLAGALNKVGPLQILGTVIDLYSLGRESSKDWKSPETAKAGVDVLFDAATIVATFACPPVALVIEGAHILFDVGYDVLKDHPELPGQIAHGVAEAATNVASGLVEAGEVAVQVAGEGVKVAEGVVSGGVNFVKGFLHF
jgi:hypothetical protein